MFSFSNSAVRVSSDVLERPVSLLVSEVDGVKYFEVKRDSHVLREIAFAGSDKSKQGYQHTRKTSIIETLKKLKDAKYKSALHVSSRVRGSKLRTARLSLPDTCEIEAPTVGDTEGVTMKVLMSDLVLLRGCVIDSMLYCTLLLYIVDI